MVWSGFSYKVVIVHTYSQNDHLCLQCPPRAGMESIKKNRAVQRGGTWVLLKKINLTDWVTIETDHSLTYSPWNAGITPLSAVWFTTLSEMQSPDFPLSSGLINVEFSLTSLSETSSWCWWSGSRAWVVPCLLHSPFSWSSSLSSLLPPAPLYSLLLRLPLAPFPAVDS